VYQDLVVPLAEPCQTLLGIVWGGLLLLGRATQKSHPLCLVSRGRRHRSGCHRQSPCGVYSRCIWVAGVWWGARCSMPHFGRMDGRGSLCNQLRRALSPAGKSPHHAPIQPYSLESASSADRHLMFQGHMLPSEGHDTGRGTVPTHQRPRAQLQGVSSWAHTAWQLLHSQCSLVITAATIFSRVRRVMCCPWITASQLTDVSVRGPIARRLQIQVADRRSPGSQDPEQPAPFNTTLACLPAHLLTKRHSPAHATNFVSSAWWRYLWQKQGGIHRRSV
jgi:hypothetical protein